MWRQFLQRSPTLPSVDVRRDLASIARWWSGLLLLGLILAVIFVVAALWVWLSLRRGGEEKLQAAFIDPTFDIELEKEGMERRLRTLERELETTAAALGNSDTLFEAQNTGAP
jgi:sensor domain CHASE-containing protein